jgi:hypothetical protein
MVQPTVILAVALASLIAVVSGSAGTAKNSAVSISVDHPIALVDAALRIRVFGLESHQRVTVLASTTDGTGRAWSSSARFRADRHGRIDLSRARPFPASYRGTAGMGLFWSMLPRRASPTEPFPPPATEEVTLVVEADGRILTRSRVVRQFLAPGVVQRDERPRAVGCYGDLFLQAGWWFRASLAGARLRSCSASATPSSFTPW